ncbi:MAG: hypothetical protein CM1200mP30_14750 [Pseudomonadota bacterium]|nr:MAG: hypothetical protein CM1200mP30_14750 [Pseudomonadota bacterium]
MDEYVGGVGQGICPEIMLEEGFYYMKMLKEDSYHMCAENLHEFLRLGKLSSYSRRRSPSQAHTFP